MSSALANPQNRIADYCNKIAAANPSEAVQIALAEAERAKAVAEQAQAEYRAMAEVEFDAKGRIVKANLAGLYRLAQAYSGSQIVPEQYRGKPSDCFIACQMAFRLGVDPLAYMQASYIVHGKPGIEAKLAVAMLNTSGRIKGRISYKLEGTIKDKTRACTASAIDAETGEVVSATVDWAMVEAEGWASKSGSKWKTMPDVMFHYRSAVFLIRLYYPEVLMGMQTRDELEDMGEAAPPARNLAELTARIEGPQAGNGQHAEPEDVIDGNADTHDRPQTSDAPNHDLVDGVEMDLAEATTVGNCEDAKSKWLKHAKTPADETMVRGKCDAKANEIRAARGERSNKG
jgi:hypothetical protein